MPHKDRKSATIKDLEIVWAHPSLSSPNPHSRKSTFLVDDSPEKAQRQPHNHLVVPEYTSALRTQDAALLSPQTAHHPTSDQTLLCLIGVLDSMKNLEDVEHWLANDGLHAGLAARSSDVRSRASSVSSSSDMDISDDDQPQVTKQWYNNAGVVSHWVNRGLAALEELGIEAEHGVVVPTPEIGA